MKKSENQFRSLISLAWFMGLLVTLLVAGCGSDNGGSGPQTGVLSVSLTDAPACGYDEVNVTVSKVRVHQSDSASENGGGWTEITLNPPRKINLLNLNDPTQPNFALDSLGETPLAAGHYSQLRLVLDRNTGQSLANSVVLSNTPGEIELETPSGIQSGIKLIHQFDVAAGQRVDLLLDFDACKSIVQTGNGTYKLKPVIKVIPYVLNGIEGFIDLSLFTNQPATNNNVNNVVVSAQINGEVIRATVPNSNATPNPNRGKFFLARLTAGTNYDVVITADGHATKIIAGVPVPTSTGITTISTASAPFTLPVSGSQSIAGTVTLNPADDDGTVVLSAKQVLSGGPTVTVKSRVARVLTNTASIGDYDYSLTLPIARPWLGSYSALPIAFTEQPAAVGGVYTVYGSAETPTAVYATQTPSPSSVNITAGSATQNFTLTTP